jgi:hypothetical protein
MKRQLKTELDREMVIAQIKRIDLSKPHTVEILAKRNVRSISQNNLYWLWLTCIEFETGNDRHYLHEFYKNEFIIPEIIEVLGKKIEVKTTTNKDTLIFKNYLDRIQVHANTEFSIKLPLPEDQYWDEFYSFYVDKL